MTNFKQLQKSCPDGIPFSKCKEYLKNKKTKLKKRSISRKKKKRTRKRPIKQRVPPKGVIIMKKNKLYKSNGKSLNPLINKKIG